MQTTCFHFLTTKVHVRKPDANPEHAGASVPTRVRVSAMMVLFLIAAFSSPIGAQPAASDAVFRKLVLERIQAYGRGDVATYLPLLADGFVHISDLGARRSKDQMRAFVGGHDNARASYRIARLSWRRDHDLAIVEAEIHEQLSDTRNALRETDIFTWHGNRWLYLLHHETAIWQAPVAMTVFGDPLKAYAGRYRTPAGTVDVITASRKTLLGRTLPSTVASPFVQVGRGAFGLADDPTLLVFLRDRTGNVTGCLWYLPSGQTVLSQRIRER